MENKTEENQITEEKITKYFDVTKRAMEKVKISEAKYVKIQFQKAGEDFLEMARNYFEDAQHFKENGNVVNAFAALNYAHGWLDAGARLGLFDVEGDDKLFAVDSDHDLHYYYVEQGDADLEEKEEGDGVKLGHDDDEDNDDDKFDGEEEKL